MQAQLDTLSAEANEQFLLQSQAVRNQGIEQGAFGGSREGITQAILADAFQENLGQQQNDFLFRNFQNERQNQINASQQVAGAVSAGLLPSAVTGQLGEQIREFEQIPLTEAQLQFQEQIAAELRPLEAFRALASLPFPSTTEQEGLQQTDRGKRSSTTLAILGGILNPLGTSAGALGGA